MPVRLVNDMNAMGTGKYHDTRDILSAISSSPCLQKVIYPIKYQSPCQWELKLVSNQPSQQSGRFDPLKRA